MQKLIQNGLSGDNLQALIQACDDRLHSDPITYFIIRSVLKKLFRRFWWDEGVSLDPEEAKLIDKTFKQPLIDVIESSGEERTRNLEKLIDVVEDFYFLRPRVYYKHA